MLILPAPDPQQLCAKYLRQMYRCLSIAPMLHLCKDTMRSRPSEVCHAMQAKAQAARAPQGGKWSGPTSLRALLQELDACKVILALLAPAASLLAVFRPPLVPSRRVCALKTALLLPGTPGCFKQQQLCVVFPQQSTGLLSRHQCAPAGGRPKLLADLLASVNYLLCCHNRALPGWWQATQATASTRSGCQRTPS